MLEMARTGVSATCRKFRISRTTCHAWKKKWDPADPRSLADSPRTAGAHPLAVSREVVETILAVSAENPAWGCKRLAEYVTMLGLPVSSPTVQKRLIRAGLGRLPQRMAADAASAGRRRPEAPDRKFGTDSPPGRRTGARASE